MTDNHSKQDRQDRQGHTPLRIEEGRFYRTRDGRKVGPMRRDVKRWDHGTTAWYSNVGGAYHDDGSHYSKGGNDLIAEWTDEPDTPKLWRDMTPEEKGALLLAHHEGKVIESMDAEGYWHDIDDPSWNDLSVYRMRTPEPKRETVELWWRKVERDECREGRCGTIDLIDGKPDPDSIRMEPLE